MRGKGSSRQGSGLINRIHIGAMDEDEVGNKLKSDDIYHNMVYVVVSW